MENQLIDVNNRFELTEEPVNLRICKQKLYNSSNNVKDIEILMGNIKHLKIRIK